MMQQTVQNGRGNDRISKDRAPIAIAFVRSQDDTAAFVTCAYQLEKDGGAQLVQRQVSHLIDDQNLGRQVDPHPPIQTAFPICTPKISNQVVGGHEVGSEARLNRSFGQSHAQMRFTNARRPEKNNVASLVNKPQRAQFLNLPFVNGRLKSEVELLEVLQEWQMRQLQPGAQ